MGTACWRRNADSRAVAEFIPHPPPRLQWPALAPPTADYDSPPLLLLGDDVHVTVPGVVLGGWMLFVKSYAERSSSSALTWDVHSS